MTSSCSDAPRAWVPPPDLMTAGEGALGQLATLAEDLANPPLRVGIRELAALWTFEQFRFRCPRLPDMEDYPELSERLRGAVGAALHRQPQPVTATGWLRPHARDVFFAPLSQAAGEDESAKPLVVRGWVEGRHLIVDLRVFGWAIGWRDEAAAATLDALRGGIAIRNGRQAQRCALEPEHVEHRRVAFIDTPPHPSEGRLRFRSPVTVRHRGAGLGTPAAILRSALSRVERMARWQGCRLVVGTGWMEAALSPIELAADHWRRVTWQRFTRNQRDTAVPMAGQMGDLILRGPLGDLATVLAMAETCNIGSHAALGMGWFDWIVQ